MGWQPNDVVLRECRKTDIRLLPSFAETLGYSALGLQSAGCPMITINIREFPEINRHGWRCKLLVAGKNWTRSDIGIEILSEILVKELVKVLKRFSVIPKWS